MNTSPQEQALNAFESALNSDFFKALSEPARVSILRILIAEGPSDVGSISAHLPQERSVISRHLKVLLSAGLVEVQREGRHRFYRIKPSTFVERLEEILSTTHQCIAECCPSDS